MSSCVKILVVMHYLLDIIALLVRRIKLFYILFFLLGTELCYKEDACQQVE